MLDVLSRRLLKDDFNKPNFVLTKKYKLANAAVLIAKTMGMTISNDDNVFTVTEVAEGGLLVYSNECHWVKVEGHSTPPPPHPEYGSPIHPIMHSFCTLVDE